MPRIVPLLLLSLLLAGCAQQPGSQAWSVEARQEAREQNVRELLRLTSRQAAAELARPGGYSEVEPLRLALPRGMTPIAYALRQYGFGERITHLEELMNRAAERAAGEAASVFEAVIGDTVITDSPAILGGPEDAATRYLLMNAGDDLALRFRPVIRRQLRELGFYDAHRLVLDLHESLPVEPRRGVDMEEHVLSESLRGLYRRMLEREAAIRGNPEEFASDRLARALQR